MRAENFYELTKGQRQIRISNEFRELEQLVKAGDAMAAVELFNIDRKYSVYTEQENLPYVVTVTRLNQQGLISFSLSGEMIYLASENKIINQHLWILPPQELAMPVNPDESNGRNGTVFIGRTDHDPESEQSIDVLSFEDPELRNVDIDTDYQLYQNQEPEESIFANAAQYGTLGLRRSA